VTALTIEKLKMLKPGSRQYLHFIIIILVLFFGFSCSKGTQAPPVPLSSDLIDGPWQLMSATEKNSNGSINVYTGISADSVLFLLSYDNNGNVKSTNITSFIGGINKQYGYKILSEGISNSIDTIVCSTAWKSGYSDTLMVTKFTDHLLVFHIEYSTINGTGIEIDSLKKIRFNKII
jgi:hypothetical protein